MTSEYLKNSLVIRGDSINCPLAFSLDTFSNCDADCWHCLFRRLNYVWGEDNRPMDVENFRRTLHNGLKNKDPKSSLACAIAKRKTLRFGNKADPFQEAERKWRVSQEALITLRSYEWPTVIETKFTHILREYDDILLGMKSHLHIMPVISPGWEEDWKLFERERTTPPQQRLDDLKYWMSKGIRVGVNGEPFIPGYHTIQQFEDMLIRLKEAGIKTYNVYNLHSNDYVLRRLLSIGIDIEKVWDANQDMWWRPELAKLLDLSKKYEITLGCPDWINSGSYYDPNNTCCGLQVDNPCTYNTHTWKRLLLNGGDPEKILEETWDGIGDKELGRTVMLSKSKGFFTLNNIVKGKRGLIV